MFKLTAKFLTVSLLVMVMLGFAVSMAVAADPADAVADPAAEEVKDANNAASHSDMARMLGVFGAVIGTGVVVFGAATGIGKVAAGATEAIARQPEAGPRIFTTMILAAAFIEGIALFGLIICFLTMLSLK